ncbi:MAG: hypothetical protein WD492_02770 [Alkalispirochaeta sp.]
MLAQAGLISDLRDTVAALPDRCTGLNTRYTMTDIALSAFSVFFPQNPSFLEFQRTMGKNSGRQNAASLFGVRDVPSDNHIRSVLDEVPAAALNGMFDRIRERLDSTGELERFRSINGDVLVTLDGTQYFRSERIRCPQCDTIHHSNGRVSYKHMLLSPAIVKAGRKDVTALAPEFIHGDDGSGKAKNEISAGKRWLRREPERLSLLSVTITGDDLYAAQPSLEQVRHAEMNSLCSCKPESHKYVTTYVERYRQSGETETLVTAEWTGKEHRTTTYEWIGTMAPLPMVTSLMGIDRSAPAGIFISI